MKIFLTAFLMVVIAILATMRQKWDKKGEATKANLSKITMILCITVLIISAVSTGTSKETASYNSSSSVTCPVCGTGFREDTAGARMIREYGHCQFCGGRSSRDDR